MEELNFGFFNIIEDKFILSISPFAEKNKEKETLTLSLTKESNYDTLSILLTYTNTVDEHYECDLNNQKLKTMVILKSK
jgi:hypothetical protein